MTFEVGQKVQWTPPGLTHTYDVMVCNFYAMSRGSFIDCRQVTSARLSSIESTKDEDYCAMIVPVDADTYTDLINCPNVRPHYLDNITHDALSTQGSLTQLHTLSFRRREMIAWAISEVVSRSPSSRNPASLSWPRTVKLTELVNQSPVKLRTELVSVATLIKNNRTYRKSTFMSCERT